MVFPRPGTPSSRTWPPVNNATNTPSMTSSCPTMTRRSSSRRRAKSEANPWAAAAVSDMGNGKAEVGSGNSEARGASLGAALISRSRLPLSHFPSVGRPDVLEVTLHQHAGAQRDVLPAHAVARGGGHVLVNLAVAPAGAGGGGGVNGRGEVAEGLALAEQAGGADRPPRRRGEWSRRGGCRVSLVPVSRSPPGWPVGVLPSPPPPPGSGACTPPLGPSSSSVRDVPPWLSPLPLRPFFMFSREFSRD